jgi:hypothetical protein
VYLEKEEWDEEDASGPFFEVMLSKQKRWFGVPITGNMKAIFQRRLKHRQNEYVFPSPVNKPKPLSDDRGVS